MFDDEIRIPDIEVVVGCASDQVATFAFYLLADVHQGYDVVCALADQDAKSVIRQILQDALKALDNANWFTLDDLHTQTDEGDGEVPF